jgi:hypothetical protein
MPAKLALLQGSPVSCSHCSCTPAFKPPMFAMVSTCSMILLVSVVPTPTVTVTPWDPPSLVRVRCSAVLRCADYDEEQLTRGAVKLVTRLKHKYGQDMVASAKFEMKGEWGQQVQCGCCRQTGEPPSGYRGPNARDLRKAGSCGAVLQPACIIWLPACPWLAVTSCTPSLAFPPSAPAATNATSQRSFLATPPSLPYAVAIAGTKDQRLLGLVLRPEEPPPLAAALDPKGHLLWVSATLAQALGHKPHALRGKELGALLPPPWGALHYKWLRVGGAGGGEGALGAERERSLQEQSRTLGENTPPTNRMWRHMLAQTAGQHIS